MIKKEIAEIKKQLTDNNCAITRICGCYVSNKKEKLSVFKDTFLTLSDDERHKYYDIFRKTLSGTPGKNLLNMSFPTASEFENGTQYFLMQLNKSELKDETLLEQFYDKVIEAYTYDENYLILLIHAAYDIPAKSKDNLEMDDASEEVYEYTLCAICPVDLAKPALSFNEASGNFQSRTRDWIVDLPITGFLFPAFNDRQTDIHSVLYYSKNSNELQSGFVDTLLGCNPPLSVADQCETFRTLIADTLGESCEYDVVRNIHGKITELLEENKDIPEPVVLDKADLKNILADSGVESEKLAAFEQTYEQSTGSENIPLLAMNVINTKTFEVKTPDIVIRVNPERTDLVETMDIEGRKCLVIEITDSVEVNGISVRSTIVE